jgi:hypothetical protein
MPRKGKQGKSKASRKREKKRAPVNKAATTAAPAATKAAVINPGKTPVKVTPRSGSTQSIAEMTRDRFPYLRAELKWIGIITVIIVAVLVILAIIIPPLLA